MSDQSDSVIVPCPTCPVCGGPPAMAWPQLVPWFCVSEDCIVLGWDPHSTLQENLMDAREAFIEVQEIPPQESP